MPDELLHRLPDQRRFAVAPRREDDDVLAVQDVELELLDLSLAIRERLVERQPAEAEGVGRHSLRTCHNGEQHSNSSGYLRINSPAGCRYGERRRTHARRRRVEPSGWQPGRHARIAAGGVRRPTGDRLLRHRQPLAAHPPRPRGGRGGARAAGAAVDDLGRRLVRRRRAPARAVRAAGRRATPRASRWCRRRATGSRSRRATSSRRAGERIVVLAEEYPSGIYTWRELARRTGAEIVTVERRATSRGPRRSSPRSTSRPRS